MYVDAKAKLVTLAPRRWLGDKRMRDVQYEEFSVPVYLVNYTDVISVTAFIRRKIPYHSDRFSNLKEIRF